MTKRVTVPAMEEILEEKFPVLDDGFIRVIDYMGTDSSIVQAARISYGKETKHIRTERGLIRYLMRKYHTSPFEMCEIKFHLRVPMDTWRQWIRTRTACLAGHTELWFDLPGAKARGQRYQRVARTIDDIYRLWHKGTVAIRPRTRVPPCIDGIDSDIVYTVPELAKLVCRRQETIRNMIRSGALRAERISVEDPRLPQLRVRGADWIEWANRPLTMNMPMRDRIKQMRLRMVDEVTGEISYTSIVDVWSTGVRPTFRIAFENGYAIEMTKDHRCLTDQGWMTLEQATGLSRTDEHRVTWRSDAPAFAVNGVPAHLDRAWLAEQRREAIGVAVIAERAGVSGSTIRKSLRAFGLCYSEAEKAVLRAQTQKGTRRSYVPHVFTSEGLARVRAARCGAASNFWKGGVATERAKIGRWTRDHARKTHERCNWKCVICGGTNKLNAHHADPIWNNQSRAYDETNLVTLCGQCHRTIHAHNLEISFLNDIESGVTLSEFWDRHPDRLPHPDGKRLPSVRKLVRGWSKIKNIEYVGEQETYDLEVAGPFHNFVANGLVVHNSTNEYSTRYSAAIDATQRTAPQEWRLQSQANKQGSSGYLPEDQGAKLSDSERMLQNLAREVYNDRLEAGVAREQARKDLPLSTYTEAYWKIDLHNLLHFQRLRMDSAAQQEIRSYANVMADIIKLWCPVSWKAFEDYRLNSMSLSAQDIQVISNLSSPDIRQLLVSVGFIVDDKPSRELLELEAKLARMGLAKTW